MNRLRANPNSVKIMFAIRLVGAMKSMNKSGVRDKYTRYRAVRAAACASMAAAVGPERAWSQAVLLRKIRLRRRRRNPSRRNLGFGDLRRLVPGGGGMEVCSLLSETAHYIKCLQAQVQVMTDILNHYST